MRTLLIGATLLAGACALGLGAADGQAAQRQKAAGKTAQPQERDQADSKHQEDETAIRASVAAFRKAYNARDAKAVAALFGPEAQIVNEEGNTVQGRDEIEKAFAGIFEETPQTQIEVSIESIRFVGTALAVETGSTKVTPAPGEAPESNRYTVVHVKARDGQWVMGLARDLPDEEATGEEALKSLAWLVGDWIDESPDSLVETSYRWTNNRRFILGQFNVRIAGRPAMSGTQRIGWDPLAKQLHSWVFDSEGGFGEGLWTRQGNQWIVKMTGVTRDGRSGSATNVLTHVSQDRAIYQSRDRVVGGESAPDIGALPIVRKPPKPL